MPAKEKTWKEKTNRKKFVKEQINILQKRFFLQGWDFSTDYFKFPCTDNEKVSMEVTTQWDYRRVYLKIYPPFWDDTEEERKNILIHEFSHVLTAQIFVLLDQARSGKIVTDENIREIKEHVTCWIQNIIQSKSSIKEEKNK